MKPLIIDKIPAGETFEHVGSVIVLHDIEEGANVNITGALEVRGDMKDGVTATVKASAAGDAYGSFASSGNVIDGDVVAGRTCNGDVIYSNGSKECATGWIQPGKAPQAVSGSFNGASNLSGITVKGVTGDNVSLLSDTSINIENAGNDLSADAKYGFSGNNIGDRGNINAGYDIELGDMGQFSNATTPRNIEVYDIGGGSKLNAGRNIEFNILESGATATAGRGIDGSTAESGSHIFADRNINLDTAYSGTVINAGRSTNIDNMVNEQNIPPASEYGAGAPAMH